LVLAGALTLVAAAGEAKSPRPVAANGKPVQVIATGVATPTSFAFDGSTVFVGSGQEEVGGEGGVFFLSAGKAKLIPGAPSLAFGLVWHAGILYVADHRRIVALSGWNGTIFAAKKTIYEGEKGFPGFNGLAIGPDGRLYAGLTIERERYDHSKDPFPLSEAVVSMTTSGRDVRVVSRGLRQPFQLTFPAGSRYPYVTDLGQDESVAPPDQIVIARPGANYGFPTCVWLAGERCKGFTRPQILLPKHASPMGIGSFGKTLYVALFGAADNDPEVVAIPTKHGKPKPFVTGFQDSIIGLGVNRGYLYVGGQLGTIYRVALTREPR
jgi:glucose/arabinose dehydrogenase